MVVKLPAGTFYGQTQERREAGGFTFAESVYTASSRLHLPLHAHENAFLYFVVEGVCEDVSRRMARVVGPSTLVFHAAGESHSNRWHGAAGRAFHIDISQARATAIRTYAPLRDSPIELKGGVAPWLANRLYAEYRRADHVSLLAMEGLALEILAELSRHPAGGPECTPPPWLLRARDLLHARFTEDLSLDQIASSVGIHPVHLARVFRRHFGCTPGDYLRKLRVESACRRLASSDVPLCEIALAAGFADQSHFTRTFRRLMRMTPGQFRRNFRVR